MYVMAIERFSVECRKTKTKVITLANHNRDIIKSTHNKPITIRSKYACNRRKARENACEQVTIYWLKKGREL